MKEDKDWAANSTAYSSTAGFHNYSTYEREKRDFYATDPIALEKLLKVEQFNNVWECACGEGNLSEVLKKHNIHGKSSDIFKRNYDHEVIDFLAYDGKWNGDIITNPPYKKATEFVYKAIEVIPEGNRVAMLFPQRYLSSKKRYILFTTHPPLRVYAFSGRVSCAMNNDFRTHSNSAIDYMWMIWEKGYTGETILKWIL